MTSPWELRAENEPYSEEYLPIADTPDGQVQGSKRFFVHNTSDRPLTASFDVVPDPRTPAQWFSTSAVQLEVPARDTRWLQVDVTLPPASINTPVSPIQSARGDEVVLELPATNYFERHSFQGRVRSPGYPVTVSKPVSFSRPFPSGWAMDSWPFGDLYLGTGAREITFRLRCPGLHPASLLFDVGAPDATVASWLTVDRPYREVPVLPDPYSYVPTDAYTVTWTVTVAAEAILASGLSAVRLLPTLQLSPTHPSSVPLEPPGCVPFADWWAYTIHPGNQPWP